MSIFAKPKLVLWPKGDYLEIFTDRKDNNIFTFDINLWHTHTEAELQPLAQFIAQTPHRSLTVLVPDDVVLIKSFIYDSLISSIEKKEVIGLAESFVPFKIDPTYLTYRLIPRDNKTIIQSSIFNKDKIETLKQNLDLIHLQGNDFSSIAESISKVVSTFFKGQYFFIYPLNTNEFTLFLSKDDAVYLTANIKGPSLDIQKIINYSSLYFVQPTQKIYVPTNDKLEIIFNTQLEKTHYLDSQIALEAKKPSNIPLPVLGAIIDKSNNNLSNKKTMENKKNYLPIIAVFVFTAVLATIAIYFIINRNKTESPVAALPTPEVQVEITPEPTVEVTPEATAEPTKAGTKVTPKVTPTGTVTPKVTEKLEKISKTIKIQVLNATDINGQAATVKDMLAKLGFTSIAVGNAKESATENSVQLKASIKDHKEYFTTNLGTDFPATYTTDLKETSTYDAVFTIGTNLKQP